MNLTPPPSATTRPLHDPGPARSAGVTGPANAAPASTYTFAPPYELPRYAFETPPELAGGAEVPTRYPIVIVGAGPAGLTLACDLASRGVRAVLIDEDDTVGVRGASSRGICYAQKSLEIFERLGLYERILDKGITWSFGRTFSGDDEVYHFNLQTNSPSRQPPFVNLQQFYLEGFLVDRIRELGRTDLRWKSRVTHVEPGDDGVTLDIDTPAGPYQLQADWVIDATGANSPLRSQLGVPGKASRSDDRWCISDVRFMKPLPVERWTWVDAPFNEGRGVWQHLMADGVWRTDYQMAPDCDPEAVSRPEVAGARLREQLGPDVEFEFVWIGPYGYRDHLLDHFRHRRVVFIGDAAHVVSPFGARGGNTGIQDAANLAWKLALVTGGEAPEALIDSYCAERREAAVENLAVTSRTARFLAPRSEAEHTLRRAVLQLARRFPFARGLVNTGRMSVPNAYSASALLPAGARSVPNLALTTHGGRATTLVQLLAERADLVALWFDPAPATVRAAMDQLAGKPIRLWTVGARPVPGLPGVVDGDGRLAAHFGADPGTVLLLRPDGYLAATLAVADGTPAGAADSAPNGAVGSKSAGPSAAPSAGVSADAAAGVSRVAFAVSSIQAALDTALGLTHRSPA